MAFVLQRRHTTKARAPCQENSFISGVFTKQSLRACEKIPREAGVLLRVSGKARDAEFLECSKLYMTI